MNATGPVLLAAAAGVGFGHAVLPDHWVPLAVLGRTRRYPMSKIARLSGLASVAHVLVSVVLGAVIIGVGLQFRSTVEHAQDTIIGCILIATGGGFGSMELTGHRHHHEQGHDHGHGHNDAGHHHTGERSRRRLDALAAVTVPFGVAASPDLTILPVFLAATTVGTAVAAGSLAIFAGVTIATMMGLTLTAARAGYRLQGEWLERWSNVLTASVLAIIGLLVLLRVL